MFVSVSVLGQRDTKLRWLYLIENNDENLAEKGIGYTWNVWKGGTRTEEEEEEVCYYAAE